MWLKDQRPSESRPKSKLGSNHVERGRALILWTCVGVGKARGALRDIIRFCAADHKSLFGFRHITPTTERFQVTLDDLSRPASQRAVVANR